MEDGGREGENKGLAC